MTYTDADDFCLDGERLVSVGQDEYRPKRDVGTLVRVTTRDGLGPLVFQVFLKDGLIETYGFDSQSRTEETRWTQAFDGDPSNQTATTVRTGWGVAKRVDRFGNELDVTYVSPLNKLPATIKYTSNLNTGRSATKTVTFNYTDYADRTHHAPARFSAGVMSQNSQLLSSIVIAAPNPQTPSVVGTYKLVYEAPSVSGQQLFTRIQRCDGAGVCMEPTAFTWSPGSLSFRHVNSTIDDYHCAAASCGGADYGSAAGIEAASRFLVSADVNGDGRMDLLYRSTLAQGDGSSVINSTIRLRLAGTEGFGPAQETNFPLLAQDQYENGHYPIPVSFDIDGDGRSDIGLPHKFFPTEETQWTLFESTGGPTFARLPPGLSDAQLNDPTLNPESVTIGFEGSLIPVDLNGDGLTDLARQLGDVNNGCGDGIPSQLGIRMNTGGVLGAYQVVPSGAFWGPFPLGCAEGDKTLDTNELFSADIDGDGRTEIVLTSLVEQVINGVAEPEQIAVHAGSAGPSVIATNALPTAAQPLMLDFNGDGLIDFISGTQMFANTGNGFELFAVNLDPALAKGEAVDINGDGLDDVVVRNCSAAGGATPIVYLSGGAGDFHTATLSDIPTGLALNATNCPFRMMDIDGDGQKDIVQAEPNAATLQIYFRQDPKPDRMIGVTNGIGATVSVDYGNFDTQGSTCSYPNACSGRNVEIVTGYTVDNGTVVAGEPASTRYSMSYSGPRADAQGAGWLGL